MLNSNPTRQRSAPLGAAVLCACILTANPNASDTSLPEEVIAAMRSATPAP